jgi:Flp pilus assembly protein protease CpaA
MFYLVIVVIAVVTIITLAVASFTDLRSREVPDWLSYSLIFSALGIRTIFSFSEGFHLLLSGLLGLSLAFIISIMLYYAHQWGGADSKLLMALGLVIGIPYPFSSESLLFFLFLLLLLVIGGVYGLFWMIFLAVRDRKRFIPLFIGSLRQNRLFHYSCWGLTFLLLIFSFFVPYLWFFLPFPLFGFYAFVLVTSVEQSSFVREVDVSQLVEGDWLAEPVRHNHQDIVTNSTLEKSDLRRLKREGISKVKVKEGIPFIPSFLLAYLVVLFGIGSVQYFFALIFQ